MISASATNKPGFSRGVLDMSIQAISFGKLIVQPMLQWIGAYSPALERLLVATALQENVTDNTSSIHGLGLYHITAGKHLELWDKYLVRDPELASQVRGLASQQAFLQSPHQELVGNLSYSSAMALMIYRAAGAVVNPDMTLEQAAELWATHFENGTGDSRCADHFLSQVQKSDLLLQSRIAA
jgi:hypothetical protein